MTVLVALLLIGSVRPAEGANGLSCPAGMVLVSGSGTVGMRGAPYGVVPTAHLAKVDAPERGCDAAVAAKNGATACWVQTDLVDPVVRPRTVSVQPFCIESHPFPGKGSEYSKDGMSVWDAHKLNELFQTGRFGARRFCTMTEFQSAVAGISANQRFIFGDRYRTGICEGDTVGADLLCKNSATGLMDYGAVHSHWVLADEPFVAAACDAPPCRGAGNRTLVPDAYIVAGGTNRVQTRQAPYTPHTWHDHGEPTADACGFEGWDDQPVVCAEPRPDTPGEHLAWKAFEQSVRTSKSVRKALSAALGGPICPD